MATIDRTNGGLVTALTTSEVSVTLNPARAYELLDLGYDSAGSAQSSARVFFTTDNTTVAADWIESAHKFALIQSSTTAAHPHRISGVPVIRLMARTAETTVLFRVV